MKMESSTSSHAAAKALTTAPAKPMIIEEEKQSLIDVSYDARLVLHESSAFQATTFQQMPRAQEEDDDY